MQILRTPHYTIAKYYPERIINILFTALTKKLGTLVPLKPLSWSPWKWETSSFLSVRKTKGEKWEKKKKKKERFAIQSHQNEPKGSLVRENTYVSQTIRRSPDHTGHDWGICSSGWCNPQIWYSLETQEWRDPVPGDRFLKL